jgi:hypothetical protein
MSPSLFLFALSPVFFLTLSVGERTFAPSPLSFLPLSQGERVG